MPEPIATPTLAAATVAAAVTATIAPPTVAVLMPAVPGVIHSPEVVDYLLMFAGGCVSNFLCRRRIDGGFWDGFKQYLGMGLLGLIFTSPLMWGLQKMTGAPAYEWPLPVSAALVGLLINRTEVVTLLKEVLPWRKS